ncbi:MAG TPA: EAL domain-containing protein, partial [Actinomycetota bacterium]|nr:EAL domain-containing protein [Actinomycetota bacterium]
GWIGPGEFLQVAEETGLIVPIGSWALREACGQLQFWRESVAELADRVEKALRVTGLPPENLVLEITETTLMEHAETAARTIGVLRTRGVRLAVDDFGTGYSSLAYLHDFPVQVLKIDRSFVGSTGGRGDVEIIRAIVALGDSLGMDVIAEGVETEEQARLLRSLGCRYGQGYRYSFPLDPPEIGNTLHERAYRQAPPAFEEWKRISGGDMTA